MSVHLPKKQDFPNSHIFEQNDTLLCLYVIAGKTSDTDPVFCPQNAYKMGLPRLTLEAVLSGIFAGFLSALLTVWRLQTDGKPGLINNIGHAALIECLFQPAKARIFLCKRCKPFSQSCIEGVNAC